MPRNVIFEGQQHTFPDDATDDEIAAALGSSTTSNSGVPLPQGSLPLGVAATPPTSETLGFEEGFVKPFENTNAGAEWLANKLGFSFNPLMKKMGLPTFAEAKANEDAKFKTAEQTETPGEIGKVVGGTVASLPVLAATRNPMLLGAAEGAMNTDANTPQGVATDAAIGAGFGKLGDAAVKGAGAIIAPKVSPAVNYLLSKGVQLTPGQIIGGTAHRMEDAGTSLMLPFISDAQGRSSQSFMKATVNEALGQIGAKLPAGVPAGHAAVGAAQGAFDKEYAGILPNLTLKADQQFVNDTTSLKNLASNLRPDDFARFKQVMDDEVMERFTQTGQMSGETMKEVEEALGKEYKNFTGNGAGPHDRNYANAVRELQAQVRDLAARSNPQYADELTKINNGYAMLTRVETAAANTKDGVFTPAQFRNAVVQADNTVRHRASAAGQALMQPLASAGEQVLPRVLSESGTAPRRMVQGLTAAALYGGAHFLPDGVNPLGVGAITAAIAPYTRVGGALASKALTARPAVAPLVRAKVEEAAPTISAATAAEAIRHRNANLEATQ